MLPLPYDGSMSEDEVALAVAASAAWIGTSVVWLVGLRERSGPPAPVPWRSLLAWVPVLAPALVLLVLKLGAASDVRDDARYLYLYTALGGTWIGCALVLSPLVGLSARDDVIERRNPSAAIALLGLAGALALAYAGGNLGEGPGWWVVLASSGFSTLVLVVLVWIGLAWGGASDAITVDRDRASGVRFALVTLAEGLVLGRAVAGDWVSSDATLHDLLRQGWVAPAIGAVALLFERRLRPNPRQPERGLLAHGLLPGLVALAFASAWVLYLGVPT